MTLYIDFVNYHSSLLRFSQSCPRLHDLVVTPAFADVLFRTIDGTFIPTYNEVNLNKQDSYCLLGIFLKIQFLIVSKKIQ